MEAHDGWKRGLSQNDECVYAFGNGQWLWPDITAPPHSRVDVVVRSKYFGTAGLLHSLAQKVRTFWSSSLWERLHLYASPTPNALPEKIHTHQRCAWTIQNMCGPFQIARMRAGEWNCPPLGVWRSTLTNLGAPSTRYINTLALQVLLMYPSASTRPHWLPVFSLCHWKGSRRNWRQSRSTIRMIRVALLSEKSKHYQAWWKLINHCNRGARTYAVLNWDPTCMLALWYRWLYTKSM